MANTGQDIGKTYKTKMPAMTDIADIQQALRMYHYGVVNWNGDDPAANSIEGYISNLVSRVATLEDLPVRIGVRASTAPTVIPGTVTSVPAGYLWIDSDDNKIYIYTGSAWQIIQADANTSNNYSWTGTHSFSNKITASGEVVASNKLNTFVDYSSRTTAIPSPSHGLTSFVKQTDGGTTINKLQYWNSASTSWVDIVDSNTVIANATQTLTNKTITSPVLNGVVRETVVDATVSASVLTVDCSVGTINYLTAAPTSNFTVNVTNAPTDNGRAITIVVIVTQGATGYIPNALQVAGSTQNIKWIAGTTPVPTSSSGKIDVFNFTLIRRGSAWTVLGNANINF